MARNLTGPVLSTLKVEDAGLTPTAPVFTPICAGGLQNVVQQVSMPTCFASAAAMAAAAGERGGEPLRNATRCGK
jgi:hypothetical protein